MLLLAGSLLTGCASPPGSRGAGGSVAVVALLGDRLAADAGRAAASDAGYDIADWAMDGFAERHLRALLRAQGRAVVDDPGLTSVEPVTGGDWRSLIGAWPERRRTGRIVVVRPAAAVSDTGPGAGRVVPGRPYGVGRAWVAGRVRTVVFVAVEVLLVDVEAAEVLARANVFNDGYLDDLRLDRGLDGLSAGQRERLRETLQGQLAAGLDGALPLLGLEAASR